MIIIIMYTKCFNNIRKEVNNIMHSHVKSQLWNSLSEQKDV